SLVYHLPVAQLIGQRLQVTLPLAGLALALATGLGVPLGLLAAHRRGGGLDALVSGLAQIGLALPSFWLGIFLILLFAVRLNWLPAGGFPGWDARSEEHTSELQSRENLVCRLLLEKKKKKNENNYQ